MNTGLQRSRSSDLPPWVPLAEFLPLVGTSGLEPPTSRLSGARSNQLSYAPLVRQSRCSSFILRFPGCSNLPLPFGLRDGGDEGIRTLDPLLAGQVLSQLSYTPV